MNQRFTIGDELSTATVIN